MKKLCIFSRVATPLLLAGIIVVIFSGAAFAAETPSAGQAVLAETASGGMSAARESLKIRE
jgi:hypothetical protein